jgi:hypothetical protein
VAVKRSKMSDRKEVINTLYVGSQKHGKTSDMASLANLGPLAYILFDPGLKKRPLNKLGINTDNIEVFQPNGYDELEEVYWLIAADLQKNPDAWNVALDSVTEMQGDYLEDSIKARVEKEKKKTSQNAENLNPFWTSRDDYGTWTLQARQLLTKFRDLPCHTAFSVLEKREITGQGAKLVPLVSPAFRSELLGWVDVIVHKVMAENPLSPNPDGVEFLGIMRSVSMYCGGDRMNMTPRVMANPTMERLVGLLEDTLDLDSDPHQVAYLKRMAEKSGPTIAQTGDAPRVNEPATVEVIDHDNS